MDFDAIKARVAVRVSNLFRKLLIGENKYYTYLVIFILLIASVLYFYGLGNYGFQMDEFYHAREVQTYLEGGKLFHIGSDPYGRSKLTTLLALASESIFSFFSKTNSHEFAMRFPIALLGIINILLVYLISIKISNKKVGVLVAAFVGTETYLMYFADYLRFYTPSITVILCLLLWNLHKPSRSKFLWSALISLASYLLLNEYFLFYVGFFLLTYGINSLCEFKVISVKEKLTASGMLLIGILSGIYIVLNKIDSGATYNLFTWKFNPTYTWAMLDWLVINYAIFLIGFLVSLVYIIFVLIKKRVSFYKIDSSNLLEFCVLLNLFFLFGFIVDAQFNFTFRVTLFFLPLIFIIFFKTLDKFVAYNYLVYIIAGTLICLNLYYSIKYHIDAPGKSYYPTKPVYEKIDIVTGNKDIGEYLNKKLERVPLSQIAIAYVGLGAQQLPYYLTNGNNLKVTAFSNTAKDDSTVEDFKKFINESMASTTYVVVNANALQKDPNILYQKVFNRSKPTNEADSRIVNFIQSDSNELKKVYTSLDGLSKIYKLYPQSN